MCALTCHFEKAMRQWDPCRALRNPRLRQLMTGNPLEGPSAVLQSNPSHRCNMLHVPPSRSVVSEVPP